MVVKDLEGGKTQVLKASWSHPFFAKLAEGAPMAVGAEGLVYQGSIDRGHWVDAKDLMPGDQLLNPDGSWAEVVELRTVKNPLTAYNLTVSDFHTFFVAANDDAEPVWVHNCGRRMGAGGAKSPETAEILSTKLSALENAQKRAATIQELPDGRIRYKNKESLAIKEGPTRGASFVTEHDPKTGNVRQWMENYNHSGQVIRVHPKSINGQTVNKPHYPPTGRELGL